MTTEDKNRELAELLPWYANGTLDADDVKRVEDGLANDSALRLQLDLIREDLEATVALAEDVPLPASLEARFSASLNAEIERNARAASAPSGSNAGLMARFAAFMTPPRLAFATAAAALVIAVQAGMLLSSGVVGGKGASYETATGGNHTVVKGAEFLKGTEFLVSLSPDATAAELTQFLNETNGRIVDGPGQSGLYRLHFESDQADTVSQKLAASNDLFAIVLPGARN